MASKHSPAATPRKGLTHLAASRTPVADRPDRVTLEAFENRYPGRDYWVTFDCPEFTALCPITGQPDFGRITIRYIPNRSCLESKSLKLYLLSFRNHGAFHEEVVNRILEDVAAMIAPRRLEVTGEFNARGGISLTVEAAYPGVVRDHGQAADSLRQAKLPGPSRAV